MMSLSDEADIIDAFNTTSGYLDDIQTLMKLISTIC